MARFIKIPQINEGKIVYSDDIINGIVFLAVKEIQGIELDTKDGNCISKNNAIKVKREKDGIHIDITVKIHYTQNVSDMAFKIQEAVRHNLEVMTEYRATCVNVHISGVNFEDYDEKIEEKTEEKTEEKSEEKTFTTENK